jgi:uncharacterized lipoprotein YbaY
MPTVEGEIIINEGISLKNAVAYVRLEDISKCDGESITLDEKTLVPKGSKLEFRLETNDYNPKADYNVYAHLSLNGSRDVEIGDYLTTVVYPVLTHGHPNTVSLTLEEVEY